MSHSIRGTGSLRVPVCHRRNTLSWPSPYERAQSCPQVRNRYTRKQALQQGLHVGNPCLRCGVGFGAGTPTSRHCSKLSNSVGIGLGGETGTDGDGSNHLSKVSSWSGTSYPPPSGRPAHTPVRPGCIPVKSSLSPGLIILWRPVSAWLSHTRQWSTIPRMGVSGGKQSRCQRKAQWSCPATNRSCRRRSRAVGPMSPKALTANVSNAMAKIDGSSPVLSN